jgi:hypothetical protein
MMKVEPPQKGAPPKSEFATRKQLIDGMLAAAGWKVVPFSGKPLAARIGTPLKSIRQSSDRRITPVAQTGGL